jgi:predicted alpha/beta hydrolase family esterase
MLRHILLKLSYAPTTDTNEKDTYFVTHGLGSITALKYIEMIDQPIEGFFSIAGFKEDAENIDLD